MLKINQMEDKRTTQVTLPFLMDDKTVRKYAKQAWNLTFSGQKKMSIYAKRMLVRVLAEIKEDDTELKPYFRFHINEIKGDDSKVQYGYIRKAFEQLMHVSWFFEELDPRYDVNDWRGKKLMPRHLLDTTGRDMDCGYQGGYVTLVLNPALTKYFVQLSHYTTFEIKHVMHFKSWYSMRLFELLSAYRDTGFWIVSIDDFNTCFDTEKKYINRKSKKQNVKMLLNSVLSEPLEELSSTKLAFRYETILKDRVAGERGRMPIVGIRFILEHKKLKELPTNINPTVKAIEKELLKWKVTHQNIVKYIDVIKVEDINKLLASWKLKEVSNRRIDDKLLYCNKAWCEEGKKAVERIENGTNQRMKELIKKL